MAAAAAQREKMRLYDETFTVKEKDPDGKKFDKGTNTLECVHGVFHRAHHLMVVYKSFLACAVSRFKCSGGLDAELLLDVNIDVYPLKVRT